MIANGFYSKLYVRYELSIIIARLFLNESHGFLVDGLSRADGDQGDFLPEGQHRLSRLSTQGMSSKHILLSRF